MPQFAVRRSASHPLPLRRTRDSLLTAAAAFSLLTLLASGGSATETTAAAVKKPKLVVEERVHETGEIARDKVVEHTFKLRNAGDATLNINDLLLPPNLELLSRPKALAPGESGTINVRVPLLNDKALALNKQLELQTNDPETPTLVLELRIQSVEYVSAKPGFARWIYVQHEKPGTISQKLAARDGAALEILETSGTPPGISASTQQLPQVGTAPREWQVDLALSKDAPVGPIIGTLLVHVKHPKQSIVPIPLSGFVRPAIVVTPHELKLGELALTAKQSQSFTVKTYSTAPMQVTRVEHNLAGFPPAELETVKAGREFRVKLAFDPATLPKGPIHGTLTLHTDSAAVPVVTVPIDGTVK